MYPSLAVLAYGAEQAPPLIGMESGRDMTGEADGMNQGVDSRDGVMHI